MDLIKQEWNYFIESDINIIIIDTPLLNTMNKTDLEKRLISNIVFELLSYLSEKEREKIRFRQNEGIKSAKNRNVKFGRPRAEITDEFRAVYRRWKSGDITAVRAMEISSIPKTTFYKLVKRLEA